MNENSEKSEIDKQNPEGAAAKSASKSDRVRRMRGWLGIKSTSPSHGHADSNEPLLYGEGHSGWNR